MPMVGSAIHDREVNKFSKYSETKASWGPVPGGYGRVVIFFEKWGVFPSGFGSQSFLVKIDQLPKTEFADQTFIFIDLPAGKHSISYTIKGSLSWTTPKEFEVLPGEIKYIRPWKTMTNQEAEAQLESIRHFYKQPLPFDKQGESAKKVRL
jgi:hypothetical protein